MKRQFGPYQVLAALLLMVILWIGLTRSGPNIRIGIIGPLSGPAAPYGLAHRNGILLALDDINERGGVYGRPLEALVIDDCNDQAVAAESACNLIYREHVVAIIGAVSSANTMAVQRVCERAGVPLLTAAGTHPFITRVNHRYVFRNHPDDLMQATELARCSLQVMNHRRVAVLHADSSHGRMGARTYVSQARSTGQLIATVQEYRRGASNFCSQLIAIRESAAEAVVIWGLARESGLALRQAREMGIALPVYGCDGLALQAFLDIAGPAAEGTIVIYPFLPKPEHALSNAFREKFAARFKTAADSFAAHGYDALVIMSRALVLATELQLPLRDGLARINQHDGVSGSGGFDRLGNNACHTELARIHDGRFVPVTADTARKADPNNKAGPWTQLDQ